MHGVTKEHGGWSVTRRGGSRVNISGIDDSGEASIPELLRPAVDKSRVMW